MLQDAPRHCGHAVGSGLPSSCFLLHDASGGLVFLLPSGQGCWKETLSSTLAPGNTVVTTSG